MRIQVKWFLTGNYDAFEDDDAIIGPNTTILELKGLVQIRYGYPAKDVGFIYKGLLENDTRLRNIGIVDQASADAIELIVHVFRDEGMEESNLPEDPSKEPIYEFSHEDFITAMKMLGKDVPVNPSRIGEMKANAPRSRPQFLNKKEAAVPPPSTSVPMSNLTTAQAPPPPPVSAPAAVPITKDIERVTSAYKNYLYGQRTEGADKRFAVTYAGVAEPYEYWDTRLPETLKGLPPAGYGEMYLEVYHFGPFEKVDATKFATLIVRMMEVTLGLQCKCPTKAREAGCMYPLIAVPILMAEGDAMTFSHAVWENFGKVQPTRASEAPNASTGVKSGNGGGGCAQQ
jgi:hypothetical protein